MDYVSIVDAVVRLSGGLTKVIGAKTGSAGAVEAGETILQIAEIVRPSAKTVQDSLLDGKSKSKGEDSSILSELGATAMRAWSANLI